VPIALTGIATCLILFWIVRFTAGTWYGVIAVVSIYQSHLLYASSRRAMIDVPALCFSLLTLLCLIFLRHAIRNGNAKLMIVWSTTTGIASGLAVSSKMNGLLIVIICGIIIGIEYFYTLRSSVHSTLNTIACGIVILTWILLIFVGSNPFLYSDPIVGTQHLLSMSYLLKVIFANSVHATITLSSKLLAVWNQISTYAPLNQNQLPGDLWLLLLGLVALTATAVKTPRFFVEKSLDIITIWIAITYIVIIFWLPVNFARYMLPLQPCNAFLVAYGVGWLVTNVASQINRLLTQQNMV
jgi:4-amino-4-deoxy-L-arabinose transferase-like glycosyltransferase